MQRLRTLHLFAGAGGGILGDRLLGHQPVCAVEINEYCQQVLSARQKDGFLPWFPIFSDVTQFDGNKWNGLVDCVAGGFPCQDISLAGRGAGIEGERSGLWSHMARVIGEVRPRFAWVENSSALLTRGLGVVLGDLAAIGYDCRWTVLGASDVGAPHKRERFWLLAGRDGVFPHPNGGLDGGSNSRRALRKRQQQFLTPCAMDANPITGGNLYETETGTVRHMRPDGKSSNRGLSAQVEAWPTPTASLDTKGGRVTPRKGSEGGTLIEAVSARRWPTPHGFSPDGLSNGPSGNELGRAVNRSIPTPCSSDWKGSSKPGQRRGQLTDPDAGAIPAGGSLNPDWVEALMGWIPGWTAMEPLAPGAEIRGWDEGWEDGLPRVAAGVPNRVQRLQAIGNGQVPECMAQAWGLLTSVKP